MAMVVAKVVVDYVMKENFEAIILNAINKIRKKFYDEIKWLRMRNFENFEKVELLKRVFCFPRLFAFPD